MGECNVYETNFDFTLIALALVVVRVPGASVLAGATGAISRHDRSGTAALHKARKRFARGIWAGRVFHVEPDKRIFVTSDPHFKELLARHAPKITIQIIKSLDFLDHLLLILYIKCPKNLLLYRYFSAK